MRKIIYISIGAVVLTVGVVFLLQAGPSRETAPAASAPATAPSEPQPAASSSSESRTREQIMQDLTGIGFQIPKGALKAPDFTVQDLDGNEVSLSDYRGNLVFLNFWATWCPPCRAEMPSMQKLSERLSDQKFVILAVDLQEPEMTVRQFIEDNRLTFSVLLDGEGQVGGMYAVRSIPTTYLIDRNGMLLGMAIGGREWDTEEVEAVFRSIIGS